MAEVVTNPLPARGVLYSDKQLAQMNHPLSRLKPIEEGDRCCNCGGDCDGDGFANGTFQAARVNGHPICARGNCYAAKLAEFAGHRDGCRCGAKERAKQGRR